jgi:PKD repeat protein
MHWEKRNMRLILAKCLVAGVLLSGTSALAAVLYVDLSSTNPVPPYRDWTTAATVIQDAVDAAAAGDEVVVTNGVYSSGGRAAYGTMTNRVAVTKPLTLRSANGPQFTLIQGYHVPGCTNGDGAIRCAYLTNGASLVGFTLSNGATRSLGDAFLEQSGGGLFGESTTAVASNCVFAGNTASAFGGGACRATLNSCTLSGNSASGGGGACESTLNSCTLTGNSAIYGGGVACESALNNCTLSGNSAIYGGGGACESTLNNCILYFNSAQVDPNYSFDCTLNYTCTAPLPPGGLGNISGDPGLASASHLTANSPCRGAGSAAYSSGADIDGEAWGAPPSMGCDEYHPGAVTGPLSVGIIATFTNVAVGYSVGLTGLIYGRTTGSAWDFGGGATTTNQPYTSHSWASPGDYVVHLRAFNETCPGGVSAAVTVHVVAPPVHYVAANSANAVAPYTSWDTAATNIQDAVDAFEAGAVPGALVLVTNGIYATGGRAVSGTMTNRVVVDRQLTVRSVNGPQVTLIQGGRGDGAVRCVYLGNGATLSGFTLTNGATRVDGDYLSEESGGGVWCESGAGVVSNCVIVGNSAANLGGGAYAGTFYACTLSTNSAFEGGSGAAFSALNNCVLSGNSACGAGGGVLGGTLFSCTLSGNFADEGGGAFSSTLTSCTLTGNWAAELGGGAAGSDGTQGYNYGPCTLNNCRLIGNSAGTSYCGYGGGAYNATLNTCALSGNSRGGAYSCTLNNCTLIGNSGGGARLWCALNNCIVYFNWAGGGVNYDPTCTLNYCCTTPLPAGGVGNISSDPQLTDSAHVSSDSPCVGAGSATFANGVDLDGEPWANPPSIGCDEFHAGPVTGPLTAAVMADYTNVAVGYAVNFAGQISGHATLNLWDFADGTFAVNRAGGLSHSFASPGDYTVALLAYNDSFPSGVSASLVIHVETGVRYASASSPNPVAPYTSWATAAINIQDAVDAAVAGGTVLVSDGVYTNGGRAVYGTMTNRAAVDKPLTLSSVNGPRSSVIVGWQWPGTNNGDGAIRCVYLTNGASLTGFTLRNGATRAAGDSWREQSGGGVYCENGTGVVSNCVLIGNSAANSGGGASGGTLSGCTLTGNSALYGGGVIESTLKNCTLSENSALEGGGANVATLNNCTLSGNSGIGISSQGGGAWLGTLLNCTLTENQANAGGGVYGSTVSNCIVYFNYATNGANFFQGTNGYFNSYFDFSCTAPQPTNGFGNITNAPLFVDLARGNLRLQSNSPCINAGNNSYLTNSDFTEFFDLDGNPRIAGGTVDIGAYEFQNPTSLISYAWLQQYALATDGSADFRDSDGDGMNNWQEWRCGTDPTSAQSALRLLSALPAGTDVTVTWQSVAGVSYFLERSTNLVGLPASFMPIATGIAGQAGTTSFTDAGALGEGPFFYRVGVGD